MRDINYQLLTAGDYHAIEIEGEQSYCLIETRVEVWENEKWQVFPQLFRVLPNFQRDEHRKQLVYFGYENVN